jgi:ABC-type multidrug transport system permease subunit
LNSPRHQGASQFFIFLGVVILNALTAASLYSLIGALSPNETVGNIFVPLTTVLFFLFAGFFVSNIPNWWIWLYYWSFFHYSFQSLMVNEFTGEAFVCGNNTYGSCITQGVQVLQKVKGWGGGIAASRVC